MTSNQHEPYLAQQQQQRNSKSRSSSSSSMTLDGETIILINRQDEANAKLPSDIATTVPPIQTREPHKQEANNRHSSETTPPPKISRNSSSNKNDPKKRSKRTHRFDYQAFWQRAWQVALENNRTLTQTGQWDKIQSGRRRSAVGPQPQPYSNDCPKVYVYNLSSLFRDVSRANISSRDYVFGAEDFDAIRRAPTVRDWKGTLRLTHQYGGGAIFEHRLRAPGNCYLTHDPHRADLFFVPLFVASKKSREWKAACQSFNVTTDLLPQLPHLNEQTSCQHFFIFGKGHLPSFHCKDWFYTPLPILRNSLRLAYSHDSLISQRPLRYDKYNLTFEQMRPNLVSIPYPSSLHWSHDVWRPSENTTATTTGGNTTPEFVIPWQTVPNPQRPTLMSYVGRFDHGDTEVRGRIKRQCQRYNNPKVCSFPTAGSGKTKRTAVISSTQILVKQEAIFCLEPEGDTPWRKSLSDSITFGCIPVLFSERTDDVAPWHWGHWKQQGRVFIDRDEYIKGKIDLHQLLSSIPDKLLQLMRLTIHHFARQFQYSLQEDAPVDGIHVTLEGLKNKMLDMKQKGLCAPKS